LEPREGILPDTIFHDLNHGKQEEIRHVDILNELVNLETNLGGTKAPQALDQALTLCISDRLDVGVHGDGMRSVSVERS
jgi:hypothetical protein